MAVLKQVMRLVKDSLVKLLVEKQLLEKAQEYLEARNFSGMPGCSALRLVFNYLKYEYDRSTFGGC